MVQLSFSLAFLSLASCALAGSAFYGLDYGVNTGACPTLESVKRDFRTLSQYTTTIRVYSIKDCNLGQLAIQASQANKMKLYLGIWIDKTDSFDKEMEALQSLVKTESLRNVEAIIVGSEVMYRGDVSADQLVDHIKKVKTLARGTKVTTSEVYYKFDPKVVNAVDFLMMNAFIYWEGKQVNEAADLLLEHYDHVKSISNGKQVRISETGWPDEGEINNESVPSIENQHAFMLAALCKTRQRGVDMIWFSAIDEEYKQGVERHFGLLDSNRQLKSKFRYEELMNPC